MAIAFEGARDTAYTLSWQVNKEMSADQELSDSDTLVKLRLRSKQLIKDNPIVAGVQQAFINLVTNVGPTIYSASPSRVQRDQINEVLDDTLNHCDITGTKSLQKIIEEIVAWSFADGDILISLPMDQQRTGLKTVVELIEANRINTPKIFDVKGNTSNVKNGVEYDAEGRIKGYWVKKADKIDSYSDALENYDFYPMYRVDSVTGMRRVVTWLFKAPLNSRPKMSRQYPLIAPVIVWLKHLNDYLEATIVGARVAACFSAFITSNNPAGTWRGFTTDTEDGSVRFDPQSNQTRRVQKLQPGQIFYLKPNEQINFASPNKPSDNQDAFLLRLYKTIAMTFRVPYPILFVDLIDVNYSSWRGGALETRKMVNRWRRDLDGIVDWICNTYILEAMTVGLVRGDVKNTRLRKRWPTSGILDPEKEARANKVALTNGTKSRQMICDEEGSVYSEILEDRQQEALDDVDIEAQKLIKQKEYSDKYDIIFKDQQTPDDRLTERRPGENETQTDLDEEDAKERRKEDGNW